MSEAISIKQFEGFTIQELTKQPELATSLLTISPGVTIPPHRHEIKEKAYYVLEGCCTVHCYPGQKACLRAGQAISIAPGTIHHIVCEYEGARILVSCTPPFDDVTWLRHLAG